MLTIESFERSYPFALDPFQRQAIAELAAGRSALVTAPTGTGKTVVAEYSLRRALEAGQRAFYTTPLKALSNQKLRDFRRLFGSERVGLLTGDIVENPEGELLVMTTEVYRNMVIQQRGTTPLAPAGLERLGCVVFDEVHYIADPERGTAWEEAIILSPPGLQLVCLSATVVNADELLAWLDAVHGNVALVSHDERAVPLEHYYYVDGRLILAVDAHGRQVAQLRQVGGEARRGLRGAPWARTAGPRREPRPEPTPDEVVAALARAGLLPAIYFVFRRRDTEGSAEACAHLGLGAARVRQVQDVAAARLKELSPEDRELDQVQRLMTLLHAGVAFHHAGMLPVLKLLVEELFNAGLLAVVCATDTLSLGINMPARSVVIGELTKFDGETRRRLLPNEYQQLAGRAGRRGIDVQGAAVIPYSPWVRAHEALAIATGDLLPILSGFTVRYNSVLNVLAGAPADPDRLAHVISSSLREFQLDGHLRAQQDRVRALRDALAALPASQPAGGADTLAAHRLLRRRLPALERQLAEADEEIAELEAQVAAATWRQPSKAELRQALRDAAAGQLVHHMLWGWGAFLGQPATPEGAVGFFLFDTAARFVRSYAELDALPDSPPLLLPAALAALKDEVPDVRAVVPAADWSAFAARRAAVAIPDLEALAADAQATAARQLGARIAKARQRRARAEAGLATLTRLVRAATSEAHPEPHDRLPLDRQARWLTLELAEATEELENLRAAKEQRVRQRLRGVLDTLARFGYLRHGQSTGKAGMLRHVFDPNGLLICEAISRGFFDGAGPDELAEAASWFAFDRDLPFANRLSLPFPLRQLRDRIFDLHREVIRVEERHGERLTPGPSATFWGVGYTWARGAQFAEVLRGVALAEGDIILALNKTLDLLRQLHDALRAATPGHPLRPVLAEAERRLNRGLVAQCGGLGLLTAAEEDSRLLATLTAAPAGWAAAETSGGPPRRRS